MCARVGRATPRTGRLCGQRRKEMPRGPIPLRVHAMIEPLIAILLIAGPWIFGFDDIDSCTIVSVVVGALMLASGLMTRWRFGAVKLIPLPVHFMTDVALGIALIVTPFAADVS